MSRTRIVRGKLLKRTGGSHQMYAGSCISRTAVLQICERGATSGVSYNRLDSWQSDQRNSEDETEEENSADTTCGIKYRDKVSCTRYMKQYGPVYWGTLKLDAYQGWDILLSSKKITSEERSIIIGMSENEGKLDSVQSYDSEIVTVGAMQKTINVKGYGEFPTQMAEFKAEYPERFRSLFEDCGWEVAKENKQWRAYYSGLTGQALKNQIREGFHEEAFRKKVPSIPLEPLINAAKDVYFQAKQIEDFILRLKIALNETIVKTYHTSAKHLRIADEMYSFKAKDILKSKLGKATLLDHHINRPAYPKFDLGQSLRRFFERHPEAPANPTNWKDEHPRFERIILEDYGMNRDGTDMINRFSRMKNNVNLK